ncbi:MAG: protein-L-isoaspartate O-methyltransferase, partial [Brevundimonas sp.]
YAAAVLARMGLTVTAQEADQAVFDVVGEALAEDGVATAVAPLASPVGENWDLIVCEGGVGGPPAPRGGGPRPPRPPGGVVGRSPHPTAGRD